MKEEIIFKIKRKLSEFGIGDPLIKLFKTSTEIEKMREKGKVLIGFEPNHNENSHRRQCKNGKFGVFYIFTNGNKFDLRKRFNSKSRASEWALYNYKGRTDIWAVFQEEINLKSI